jgi:hypothetical protein
MEAKISNIKDAEIVVDEAPSEVAIAADSVPSEIAMASLNKHGGTIERACKELAGMLDAKIMTVDKYGEEHFVDDKRARHLGAISILEIHKVIKDKNVTNINALWMDETKVQDAKRVLGLRSKIKK